MPLKFCTLPIYILKLTGKKANKQTTTRKLPQLKTMTRFAFQEELI